MSCENVSGGVTLGLPNSSTNTKPQTFDEFEGNEVGFPDGSFWKLTKPLSNTAYQQNIPPFEARRVFTAVCVEDPNDKWVHIDEAVVKVKYQIKGSEESIQYLEESVSRWTDRVLQCPDSEEMASNAEMARLALRVATEPTDVPSEATFDEDRALQHFASTNCQYTPQLLCHTFTHVTPTTDREGIVGGYAIFMLMTKLPGERLTYKTFWNMPLEKRDTVRSAFKEALLEVKWQGFSPMDCAMRNILWHEEESKCYIVDFEDYSEKHYETKEDLQLGWYNDIFRWWKIHEACFTGWYEVI